MQRKVRSQNNDYYRGVRAAKAGSEPYSGHSRMSKATIDYMAGYNDTRREIRDGDGKNY